jgi:lysyl-tRNA synthetase class 2
MMDLVETIASQAALAASGSALIELDGMTVDLKPPWRRVRMADLIEERTGARMHPSMPIADARTICCAGSISETRRSSAVIGSRSPAAR